MPRDKEELGSDDIAELDYDCYGKYANNANFKIFKGFAKPFHLNCVSLLYNLLSS